VQGLFGVADRLRGASEVIQGAGEVEVDAGLSGQVGDLLAEAQRQGQVAEGIVELAELDLRAGDAAVGLGLRLRIRQALGGRESQETEMRRDL
jgi:hypothetical protein